MAERHALLSMRQRQKCVLTAHSKALESLRFSTPVSTVFPVNEDRTAQRHEDEKRSKRSPEHAQGAERTGSQRQGKGAAASICAATSSVKVLPACLQIKILSRGATKRGCIVGPGKPLTATCVRSESTGLPKVQDQACGDSIRQEGADLIAASPLRVRFTSIHQ